MSCNKKLISSSKRKTCSLCKQSYHKLCIPGISRYDPGYKEVDISIWYCVMCTADVFPFNHYNDEDDFINAISELWPISLNISIDALNRKVFIPFELNTDVNLPLYDIDPDMNFYHLLSHTANSDYYLEDSFNTLCRDSSLNENCFSIIHSNIRSIKKNINDFTLYLNSLDLKFSVIAFSETWLNDATCSLYNIDGYHSENNYRTTRKGGGVSLYIKNSIEYKTRSDLDYSENVIESKFIEISKEAISSDKDVIIGVIYHPPNTDVELFNDKLTDIIRKIKSEKKLCYLAGDYNLNLLNAETHSSTSEFIEMMFSNMFYPMINKPTRVTSHSASLIDNIFINCTHNKDHISGILYTDISDHFPIFIIDKSSKCVEPPKFRYTRVYSAKNINAFKNILGQSTWNDITATHDPQLAFSSFFNNLHDNYNKCFPVKKVQNNYYNKKPWLSYTLKQSIKRKNNLYNRIKYNNAYFLEGYYNTYKRILQNSLRKAEKAYYDDIFTENKSNLVKSWKIIKSIINKNSVSKTTTKFIINNTETDNKLEISESFNNFYVNLGSSLAEKLPSTDVDPISYMNNVTNSTLSLEPVTEDEVKKIMQNMKNSSAGWDDLSPKTIKSTYTHFLKPLVHICNLSLLHGVFPQELKIARVIPLYKGGDSSYMVNYRPVSVLPVFSKVLERIMYDRVIDFINLNDLLHKLQFGFRALHSTSIALMILVDKITKALHSGEYVLGVFIDFSKAFDTVNHEILLRKLHFYGITGTAYKWFASYLHDRSQYVTYNNTSSSKKPISCGVPQGSILGPLLFLLYINDIANISDILYLILFADDTNAFLSGKNINQMISTMNVELEKLSIWLYANKLSLNVAKTHFIIFRSIGMKKPVYDRELIINDEVVLQQNQTKFLGVILDEKLTWDPHIKYIKPKIAKGIGIVNKAKRLINSKTLLILYYSFIYPYFNYAVEVWGDTCDSYLKPLITLQKRAIRTITSSGWDDHTAPLFKQVKVLQLEKIHVYKIVLIMFKVWHKLVPNVFASLFI